MLDSLLKNPEVIGQWVAVIVALVALIKGLIAKDKTDKWQFIREAIPEIHDLVQKIAPLTKTTKDDLFVAKMDEILKAVGWSVKPHEVTAVKMLGEGFHQSAKAVDGLGKLGISLTQSEQEELEK